MQSFLDKIVDIYHKHIVTNTESEIGIEDVVFVFPNKRAGLFFIDKMKDRTEKTMFAPRVTDINEFAESFSSLKKTDKVELLMVLYSCYLKVASENGLKEMMDFGDFISTGNAIMADFDEIDKYLCDVDMLYQNVSSLKDLTNLSSILTKEQVEVIERFWGHVLPEAEWEDESLSFNKQFVTLWNVMNKLYHEYRNKLRSQGIGYEGMIYKDAIARLELGSAAVDFRRVVFAGFNRLTDSERKIMQFFNHDMCGDYYFDYPTQYDNIAFHKSIAIDYNENSRQFHSLYSYEQESVARFPEVHTYGVASFSGQTKVAGQIVDDIARTHLPQMQANEKDGKETVDTTPLNKHTAVVLADETLLDAMTSDLPDYIRGINITMGYPFKLTAVASLVNAITALQHETTKKEGETQFYHKPLINTLTNPYVQNAYPQICQKLTQKIGKDNLIRVTKKQIEEVYGEETFFALLLSSPETIDELIIYIKTLLDIIKNKLIERQGENQEGHSMETEYIERYKRYLNLLSLYIERHDIKVSIKNFSTFNTSIINAISIPFEGKPLRGLQIMGKLEARLLDFDDVIIVGANDNNLPGEKKNTSLIPYNLRRAYGLPTYEHEDAIYAYNFYRMMYRAKRVHLVYDTRGDSGEISRYYFQTKYLINEIEGIGELVFQNHELGNGTIGRENKSVPIVIEKNDKIMAQLDKLRFGGEEKISASGLKKYINCPLQFYFDRVTKLGEVNDVNESMQANKLGDIFHKTMELLYNSRKPDEALPKPTNQELDYAIKSAFQELKYENIDGINALIFNIVKQFVESTLKFDSGRYALKKFEYDQGEKEIISDVFGLTLRGFIDRIDHDCETKEKQGLVHIIDYKTTKVEFQSWEMKKDKTFDIERLFDSYESRAHEQFQALLYSYVYSKIVGHKHIQPTLYNTFKIINKIKRDDYSIDTIKLKVPISLMRGERPDWDSSFEDDKKEEIEVREYEDVSNAFEWLLERMIREIMNPDIPFKARDSKKDDNCRYCTYKNICNVEIKNDRN